MVREVHRADVQRLLAEGAQLVEVLPAEEYEREHIAGAINIPLARLGQEAGRLRRDGAVIVYCYDSQ
jgi:rhodanese-related sulfurtransferase